MRQGQHGVEVAQVAAVVDRRVAATEQRTVLPGLPLVGGRDHGTGDGEVRRPGEAQQRQRAAQRFGKEDGVVIGEQHVGAAGLLPHPGKGAGEGRRVAERLAVGVEAIDGEERQPLGDVGVAVKVGPQARLERKTGVRGAAGDGQSDRGLDQRCRQHAVVGSGDDSVGLGDDPDEGHAVEDAARQPEAGGYTGCERQAGAGQPFPAVADAGQDHLDQYIALAGDVEHDVQAGEIEEVGRQDVEVAIKADGAVGGDQIGPALGIVIDLAFGVIEQIGLAVDLGIGGEKALNAKALRLGQRVSSSRVRLGGNSRHDRAFQLNGL